MKNKQLVQKVIFIAVIVLILFSLVAPAIFSQTLTIPKQEQLLNGLKVFMWSDTKADRVTVRIRIHAGAAFDPQGREGVMQILADNIFPNEASREYFTEDLGGSLEVVSNYDFIEVNASSKPEGFLSMLETIAAAVANPVINKDLTVKLRTALAAKVAARETEPEYIADQAVAARLLGTFPYGRPQDGTSSSIQNIDFADLIDAKSRFLTADNATIAVYGNFDRALGYRAIRRYFGGWIKSDKKVPATFRQPDNPLPATLIIAWQKPGTAAIRYAFRGVARSDKDFGASMVFTRVLEDRLKSRVPAIFSDGLFVRNYPHALAGIIMIGFAAGKGDVGEKNGAIEANELVGKALSDPITDAEFRAAKAAFQSEWAKRENPTIWLDTDTYKLSSPDVDARVAELVKLADVTLYAEKVRKLPIASVLLNAPPPVK